MKTTQNILLGIIFVVLTIGFASAVIVDADFVTLFSGEDGRVSIEVDNNEDFDIESVSLALELGDVPFTSVSSSEKGYDDINEDDEETETFTLRASTDITPGDYNIPYVLKYTNSENTSENFEKKGSFGIRVSAKTDLDFSAEVVGNAILGQEGEISLEIVNRGLGEIKSVSVQILPNGFELLSKDKIFVGTVDSDDSDTATFDVIYKSRNPVLSARIEYKDFDNKDIVETVNIPFRVYTEQEALNLGIISKSNAGLYALIFAILIVMWLIWRRIRKRRKRGVV